MDGCLRMFLCGKALSCFCSWVWPPAPHENKTNKRTETGHTGPFPHRTETGHTGSFPHRTETGTLVPFRIGRRWVTLVPFSIGSQTCLIQRQISCFLLRAVIVRKLFSAPLLVLFRRQKCAQKRKICINSYMGIMQSLISTPLHQFV